MPAHSPLKPKGFILKKWTLFSFTLLAIVSTIAICLIGVLAINAIDIDDFQIRSGSKISHTKHNSSISFNLLQEGNFTEKLPVALEFVARRYNQTSDLEDALDAAKKYAISIIIAISVVSILVQLFGLVGALKEQYCMVLTYCVLCVIIALTNLASVFEGSTGSWFSFGFYLFIACTAYSFGRDIRRLRTAQLQISYVTPNLHNPNVFYGVQGQAYPAQMNVQQFDQVAGHSQNMAHGQQYPMGVNNNYSNNPGYPYQPAQFQFPANQQETSFANAPGEHPSSMVKPPPYVDQENTQPNPGWNLS